MTQDAASSDPLVPQHGVSVPTTTRAAVTAPRAARQTVHGLLNATTQSFRLGAVFGVDVRVHATFLLLFALLSVETWRSEGATAALTVTVQFAILFACVLLHELGHSLVARRFGVVVHDILLWPLGGVARIATLPDSTRAELAIALAGPAVNFALLVVLVPWLVLRGEWPPTIDGAHLPSLLEWAVFVNLGMGTFNLLPAFPMDGGRVLRALLAHRLRPLAATCVAVLVGRLFALAGFVVGMSDHEFIPIAVLGAFVWWIGGVELASTLRRASRSAAEPSP